MAMERLAAGLMSLIATLGFVMAILLASTPLAEAELAPPRIMPATPH